MKTLRILVFLFSAGIFSLTAYSHDKTGKVYFLRSTNYVGSAVNFHFFIDSILVCNLKNNKYSVHDVSAGEHSFYVQNSGLAKNKKSRVIKIQIKPDQPTYISVVNGNPIYLQEVTQSSGETLIKRLAVTRDCLPKNKKN